MRTSNDGKPNPTEGERWGGGGGVDGCRLL